MPTLKIDGIVVTVDPGATILMAAQKVGVEIPVFCYHEKLDPMGACRVCMVEVNTPRGPALMVACATPASEGMEVNTQAAAAVKMRSSVIELMLTNHPLDCPVCDRGGECDLQDNTFQFGPGTSRFEEPKRVWDDYDMGPYIARCQNRCIRCFRCVRYYDEIVGKPELGAYTRGCTMEIRTFNDQPLEEGLSGNLSEVCPVGALLDRTYLYRARPWEVRDLPTICSHCSYGCSIRVGVRQGKVLRVKPLDNEEVNEVWLCDRGRFAHTHSNPDRMMDPMVRKNGILEPVSWEEAGSFIGRELGAVLEANGPDSVGGIASPSLTNEDLYAFQKLMRFAIGSGNIDHSSICLGNAMISAIGYEGATLPIAGLEKSKLFLVLGSDLAQTQPVMGTRVRKAVRRGARFIGIASSVNHYNMAGSISLVCKSESWAALLKGLVSVIVEEQLFVDGAADLLKTPEASALMGGMTVETAASETGLATEQITSIAREIASSAGSTYLFGEEVLNSPDAALCTRLIIFIAGLTGSLGREDAGIMPLFQECNSQGATDMGVRPDLLPGFLSADDTAACDRLSQLWGGTIPTKSGLGWPEMLTAAGEGGMQAMIVAGQDLALDPIGAMSLSKLRLLIVSDTHLTETARMAHVVLPARSALEKQGTVTNIEHRVQVTRPVLSSPGSARADWEIAAFIASSLGKEMGLKSAASILKMIGQVVPHYAGIDFDTIGRFGRRWEKPL